jgi:glycosyltransferase involved in cell wall biosynthesis
MKILFIITDYGSFNNFLSELSLELILNPNNQIHVICSNSKIINIEDKFDNRSQNIKFKFIDIPRKFNFFKILITSFQINKYIKYFNPDLVHVHFTTAIFVTSVFAPKNFKYWATFHGLGMNSTTGLNRIIFKIIENYSIKKMNKIFVINNEDYKFLFEFIPEKVYKHKALGLGCNLHKFNPNKFSDAYKKNLRKNLNVPNNFKVICFTGRFVHFKGFHIVIKVFKKYFNEFDDNIFLILIGGKDTSHDTGLNEEDSNYLKDSKNIINIGFTSNVENYLAISDLFIFPSKKEGLPISLLEAMAMGIPSIAFNTRGSIDLITNDINGKIVQQNELEEIEVLDFCYAIHELLNNFILYKNIRNNTLDNRNIYSRMNFVLESIELYNKL